MANLYKTEAEVRADKKAADTAQGKIDATRKQELDGMLTRLGSVAAVFQMRADSVPVPAFRRMSELMDIYIAGGIRAAGEGQDFIAQGIKLSEQETGDLQRLMRDIFNFDAGGAATPKPEQKK